MNNKYFRVDDIKVADIMSVLLNETYYKFTDKKTGSEYYIFKSINSNINKIYGIAMRTINKA